MKSTKYLKYAAGEIVLVVVGILIALQINNWNEERKHEKTENEFFKGIAYDLNQDLEFIQYVKNSNTPKFVAYNKLRTSYPGNYSSNKKIIDSLLAMYLFSGQRTFYPVPGSFKSALAGNEINTYKQKKRIQAIIKLYGNYDRLIDNGTILDQRWSKLSETYIHNRRTNSFENISDDNYIQMLDDFHFHYIQLNWYTTIQDEIQTEIKNLLQELQ
jgi:hypothetical protein